MVRGAPIQVVVPCGRVNRSSRVQYVTVFLCEAFVWPGTPSQARVRAPWKRDRDRPGLSGRCLKRSAKDSRFPLRCRSQQSIISWARSDNRWTSCLLRRAEQSSGPRGPVPVVLLHADTPASSQDPPGPRSDGPWSILQPFFFGSSNFRQIVECAFSSS